MFSVGLMPSSQIYGHLHDLVLSARLPDAGHQDWAAFLETNGSSLGRLRSNWSRLLGPVSMERMPGNHSLSAQRPQELRLSCQTDGPWCS